MKVLNFAFVIFMGLAPAIASSTQVQQYDWPSYCKYSSVEMQDKTDTPPVDQVPPTTGGT